MNLYPMSAQHPLRIKLTEANSLFDAMLQLRSEGLPSEEAEAKYLAARSEINRMAADRMAKA